jgi:hypothetical protein
MSVCEKTIEPIFDNECLGDSLLKINNNFLNIQDAVCELKTRIDTQVEVRTFFYYGPNAQTNAGSGLADGQTSRPSDITIQAFANSPTQLNLPSISKPGDVAYVIYQKTGYLNSLLQGTNVDAPLNPSTIVRGAPVNLLYNTWYNVKDYASAIASCDGAKPNRLGTIGLTFRTEPNGQETPFSYRASGTRDDTYVEWNQNKVTYSEGFPGPKTIIRQFDTPYKGIQTTQFKFTIVGNVISKSLKGTPQRIIPGSNIVTQDVFNSFAPVFIIWRLTCQPSQVYTVDVGFPKFTRAQQSAAGNINTWNNPQNWSTYSTY